MLTTHVGGLVNLVYKLAPATCVILPWTSILSMGIWGGGGGGGGGGEVLYATETAFSSTRLSVSAYA